MLCQKRCLCPQTCTKHRETRTQKNLLVFGSRLSALLAPLNWWWWGRTPSNTWPTQSTFHLCCVFQSLHHGSAGQPRGLCWCCCCTERWVASLGDVPQALVGDAFRPRGSSGESPLQQSEETTNSTRLACFFLRFAGYLSTFWHSVCLQVPAWKFMEENKIKTSFWRNLLHLKSGEWLLALLRITGFNKGFIANPTSCHHVQQAKGRTEVNCLINAELFSSLCNHPVFFRKCFK